VGTGAPSRRRRAARPGRVAACPLSTRGGTRLVRLVRGRGGGNLAQHVGRPQRRGERNVVGKGRALCAAAGEGVPRHGGRGGGAPAPRRVRTRAQRPAARPPLCLPPPLPLSRTLSLSPSLAPTPPPSPLLRTNRTRCVPHPVLIGHATSFTKRSSTISAGRTVPLTPRGRRARDESAAPRSLSRFSGLLQDQLPSPPPRTKWTRRVPHPVLIGHAASLTPY
jgi:hypothetical protein